ncbi:MAG: AMP-binding protein [Acidobacteria bacterium]|nr:AMP-binding protein [Acidobacteriota bacterium]
MSSALPLSYSAGPTEPLLDLTIGEALRQTAQRWPDRVGIVVRHQNVRLTWREFDAEVDRTARGLAGLGLQPLDRVGIWAANHLEWVLLQYACARAGYVLVNVNPAYRSHELAYVLRKSGMKALFLFERDARTNFREILEAAREPGQALEHVVYLGSDEWSTMLANGADLPTRPVLPDDPTNMQYTSGTTGSPKGVVLTHRGLVNNAWYTGEWMQMTEEDVFCIPFPLYHCAGCVCSVLNSVVHGTAMVFPSALFDPRAVLEAIEQERATVLGGVPTMFIAQLAHPEFSRFDTTSLRVAVMGGAPCPVELLRRVNSEMHCRDVNIVYGQTEASPVITMNPPEDNFEQRTSTVGKAVPNTEVKIIDPVTGETVPIGQQGELCTRGYLLMQGYDGDPEATARAIDAEGWLHTGDLATMRDDAHFHITGRAKDMIIRGGENIYPAEIEEFLYSHPKVAEVQVVGLPDLKFGEIVAAWVRLKPSETATADELRDYCKSRISHFKIPAHIRIVDTFPLTVTGKVQKFKIRQTEIEQLGLQSQQVQTA